MNHLITHKHQVSRIRRWASCGENQVIYVPIRHSTIVENPLQIGPLMQNKAKVKIGKMNTSIVTIKDYGSKQRTISHERCSKQTQTKPISKQKPALSESKLTLSPAEGSKGRTTDGRRDNLFDRRFGRAYISSGSAMRTSVYSESQK